MFFDTKEFNFVPLLEANLMLIKEEFKQLKQQDFIKWPEKSLYTNQGWTVFGMYAYGKKIQSNCKLCPETTRLLEMIPGLVTAGFSSLLPETHILPHSNYDNNVLTCHLGLTIPDDCVIRVGNQIKTWQEGKCLIFDDTKDHEAGNFGQSIRTILLINFQHSLVTDSYNSDLKCSPEVAELIELLTT